MPHEIRMSYKVTSVSHEGSDTDLLRKLVLFNNFNLNKWGSIFVDEADPIRLELDGLSFVERADRLFKGLFTAMEPFMD